jgi:hypothetical protein
MNTTKPINKYIFFYNLCYSQLKNANNPANNTVVIKPRLHIKAKQAVRNAKQPNDKPSDIST